MCKSGTAIVDQNINKIRLILYLFNELNKNPKYILDYLQAKMTSDVIVVKQDGKQEWMTHVYTYVENLRDIFDCLVMCLGQAICQLFIFQGNLSLSFSLRHNKLG